MKYGFSTLEFEMGKTAIVVGNPEKLDAVIATPIEAVKSSEADTALEAAAKATPARRPATWR